VGIIHIVKLSRRVRERQGKSSLGRINKRRKRVINKAKYTNNLILPNVLSTIFDSAAADGHHFFPSPPYAAVEWNVRYCYEGSSWQLDDDH